MRRLITALVLIVLLIVFSVALAAQAPQVPQLYGRRDAVNHVICYATTPTTEHISCVYVPPDGTSTRLPELPNRV